MEILLDKHFQIIRDTSTDFVRSIANKIHWDERLIGIKGAKGTGKTTLLLQHIKTALSKQKVIMVHVEKFIVLLNRQSLKLGNMHIVIDVSAKDSLDVCGL